MRLIKEKIINSTYLIVDGYNVINAIKELKELSKINFEEARNQLIEMLVDYKGYSGEFVIVVFDAFTVKGSNVKKEIVKGIEVVFTKEHQTADSYIEILVENLLQKSTNRVKVVTSDWAEQQVVLGSGAIRMAPRELVRDLKTVKKDLKEKYVKDSFKRNFLEDSLDADVLRILEKWRKD